MKDFKLIGKSLIIQMSQFKHYNIHCISKPLICKLMKVEKPSNQFHEINSFSFFQLVQNLVLKLHPIVYNSNKFI